jgi:hypothetical protein
VRFEIPRPQAFARAAETATVQSVRYVPKYARTHQGRYAAQLSSAVRPVASWNRATDSLRTNLKKAPSTIAQRRTWP